MIKKICIGFVLAPLCLCSIAFADDGDTCSQSCDAGKVLVSFADGNQSTCLCVDQGSPMEPSVDAVSTGCTDTNDSGACS